MMNDYPISCVCTFGLESVLKREIWRLGYKIESVADGAVTLRGDAQDILKLNLNLRCADRVFIGVGERVCESFDDLFDFVYDLPWEEYLPKNAVFDVVKASCVKSKIMSETDTQRIVKKAVANRLLRHYRTDILPETGNEYPIHVKIKSDKAIVYINTSGDGLNKRGYRQRAGTAPLKETLAAGIIGLTNFTPERQLADVMCGSGTFVIEGAMLAANIPPGLHRSFLCESWNILTEKQRMNVRNDALSKIVRPELKALGSDIDLNMVRCANENAVRAGVEELTAFQKMDFSEFKSRKKCGVMVVNPPYGERMGDKKSASALDKGLRELYESLNGWQLAVITASESFEKDFGLKADKNRKLFNGNIKSYLYLYGE